MNVKIKYAEVDFSTFSLEQLSDTLKEIMTELTVELLDEAKGNKTAGKRARALTLFLNKVCKAYRPKSVTGKVA